MGRKKTWNYTKAPDCKTGVMVCSCCNRAIETGWYRYRETEEKFINQHRSCSEADPMWARLDAQYALAAKREAERIAAFNAFVSEYGYPFDLMEDVDQSPSWAQALTISKKYK